MTVHARAPKELRPRGRKFWNSVLQQFELDADELELLRETCRTLDDLDALKRAVDAAGSMVKGSEGQDRLHPAYGEMRSARLVLARLLKQLDLPEDMDQQRSTAASESARNAAQQRWRMEREKRARHG